MSKPSRQGDAKIYDQGYRPFTGQLASPRSRFVAIATNELRQAWKDKWFKRLLWVSFIPLVVFSVLVVVSARFPGVLQGLGEVWVKFWGVQSMLALFMVFFVGRMAVGEDLRTGALTVYFSRPVSFFQYLFGKWLAISVGVVGVTLFPGVVLALFRWLAEPQSSLVHFLGWIGILALMTILLCLTLGWVMLAISSLTRRGRAAGIVWFVIVFVLNGVAEGLVNGTDLKQLEVISFFLTNLRLSEYLFEGTGSALDRLWLGLGQLGWIVMGMLVVLFRLRRWVKV